MKRLGDSFSENILREQFKKIARPSAVFRFKTHLTNPPKIKRFVILGISSDIALVVVIFFNSEINVNKFKTDVLKKLHIPLKSKSRSYLDRDSYLDCSQIHEIPYTDIESKYINNTKVYLDNMSSEDFKSAITHIKSAKTIPFKMKKKYGVFLYSSE
jgi:hypothetical protein